MKFNTRAPQNYTRSKCTYRRSRWTTEVQKWGQEKHGSIVTPDGIVQVYVYIDKEGGQQNSLTFVYEGYEHTIWEENKRRSEQGLTNIAYAMVRQIVAGKGYLR